MTHQLRNTVTVWEEEMNILDLRNIALFHSAKAQSQTEY